MLHRFEGNPEEFHDVTTLLGIERERDDDGIDRVKDRPAPIEAVQAIDRFR
jgi:hypothetical protein